MVGAVAAAVTGLVQYLDTRDAARRETAVHAALNNVALGLYVASWALRSRGRRSLGRALAASGLGVVSVSGWLGGDSAETSPSGTAWACAHRSCATRTWRCPPAAPRRWTPPPPATPDRRSHARRCCGTAGTRTDLRSAWEDRASVLRDGTKGEAGPAPPEAPPVRSGP